MGKKLSLRLKGMPTEKIPFWLMRQAGRYLPEYQDLRKQREDFLSFCLTPSLASEATLQPIRRFGMDGAILFADILLMPYALGQGVVFAAGHGPCLDKISEDKDLQALSWKREKIEPVFETIDRVKGRLGEDTTLIGFCGGPWTVACYMLGGSGKNIDESICYIRSRPAFLSFLMDMLILATTDYLLGQIAAGAEAIQIFESHAGLLRGDLFSQWIVQPTKRIVEAVKAQYPHIPFIGFPRGADNDGYSVFSEESGVDVIALDQQVERAWAQKTLRGKVLQGNLDPHVLLRGGEEMDQLIDKIKEDWGEKHIFNLGHGVLPKTPIAHVERLVARLKE